MYYFYIIQNHSGRPGFGVTKNPHTRLKDYIAHMGEIVTFNKVYSGSENHIKHLERILKVSFIDDIWTVEILSQDIPWHTEWLKDGKTIDDLLTNVNYLLKERMVWKIELIKESFTLND